MTRYQFLIDTYATERLKVLSVWSMFRDQDLAARPDPDRRRGRSVLEQMVHQCTSENNWFRGMFQIEAAASPLPSVETRAAFLERYARDSATRLESLRGKDDAWWETEVSFFDVTRSRTWIMTRRIAHTAHHRGQQTALLRMLGRDLHSTYGPTADTGGLTQNQARVIYPYPDEEALLKNESESAARGGNKAPLPGPGGAPPTERP